MSWFSFYVFSFFFYKIGEQESGTGPAQWRGKVTGKGVRRVKKMYTHICKCKNDTC
jgi:hypothetical protein